MKKLILLIFFIPLFACRNDSQNGQVIDQVMQIFVQDVSGKDMLNAKIPGAYQSISLFDLGGIRDQIPISGILKKTADTLTYLEYTAGAARNLVSPETANPKLYSSDIMLKFQKAGAADYVQDTLKIDYVLTPEIFQVAKVFYNRKLVFTKTQGAPNRIIVIK